MKTAALTLGFLLMLAGGAFAQPNAAPKYFTDTELTDQNGRTERLYSDLMDNKVVIVWPFHVNCPVGQAVQGTLRSLRDRLGDRWREFNILEISVDEADSPASIKAFAVKADLGTNTYFLTGTRENLVLVRKKFGISVDKPDDHPNILLVGNVKTGLWKKVIATARPGEIQPIVESVLNDQRP